MSDESAASETSIKRYGIRQIKGYYNLNSGRLEEINVQVIDAKDVDKWYTVSYIVDLGTAIIDLFPEISDPSDLAHILSRADAAVSELEPISEVERWHDVYISYYEDIEHDVYGEFPDYSSLSEDVDSKRNDKFSGNSPN